MKFMRVASAVRQFSATNTLPSLRECDMAGSWHVISLTWQPHCAAVDGCDYAEHGTCYPWQAHCAAEVNSWRSLFECHGTYYHGKRSALSAAISARVPLGPHPPPRPLQSKKRLRFGSRWARGRLPNPAMKHCLCLPLLAISRSPGWRHPGEPEMEHDG